MVSHDPTQPKPTNIPPIPTEPIPLVPRPPTKIPQWVIDVMPRLDLIIEDLLCPGATQFLTSVQPVALLQEAVSGVLTELYDEETVPDHVEHICLIIKETDGVAFTCGDRTKKTIVFNTRYIADIGQERTRDEIIGVIRHEVVHCFQHNAHGTAPSGLIEGIADFVRLRSDLAPPHWKRGGNPGERWDAGYEKTAYFLDWLERIKGEGTVRRINLALSKKEYYEDEFWTKVVGENVEDLWKRYAERP